MRSPRTRLTPLQILGKAIRSQRELQKLTQEELAEACDVHPNYIGLVERGERNVPIMTLLVISNALRVRPEQLIDKMSAVNREIAQRELNRLRRQR